MKNQKQIGQEIHSFIEQLFPICRSITGDGVRETLEIISQKIPVNICEVPSGTKVFDWTIPEEWNIKDAYIINPEGKKIIDFKKLNLHVVNYSQPINKKISLEELKKHLHTFPAKPDWVPYKTSYYKKDWGFCIAENQLKTMKEGTYNVVIDSSFSKGSLTYGEFFIKGETEEEVFISTHICHPSMCNDNLTGIAIATFLADFLLKGKRKYSYRIIFVPATIGAITWLSQNENKLKKIKYGLVAALLGDSGNFNYKKSRVGNAEIDKIVEYVLQTSGYEFRLHNFSPYGYDERQYCSPGINLPLGRLTRSQNNEYEEYHTSADNLDFVKPQYLEESYRIFLSIINIIENNKKYINLFPKGEPQLGKRGLYNSVAGNIKEKELAMLWILNYSDGENDLLDIAIKSKLDFNLLVSTAQLLEEHNLLKNI